MKKKYVKPELLYEQYMLNQHMASGCQMELQNADDINKCVAVGNEQTPYAGTVLFMAQDICGMEMLSTENYCYFPSSNSIATIGLQGSGV